MDIAIIAKTIEEVKRDHHWTFEEQHMEKILIKMQDPVWASNPNNISKAFFELSCAYTEALLMQTLARLLD